MKSKRVPRVHWQSIFRPGDIEKSLCGTGDLTTRDQSKVTCAICRNRLGLLFSDAQLDAAAKLVIDAAATNPSARALSAILGVNITAQHPDDIAVDLFAHAMKSKLAKKRTDGYGGWNQEYNDADDTGCSVEYLWWSLRGHVDKGDPVDIGNFAMMIFNRTRRT